MVLDQPLCRIVRWSLPAFLSIGIALSAVVPAVGQEGDGAAGPPALEFSFSNPGARAMGFGAAFAALADDATAGFVNPAGLVQLIEREVSIEVRSWSFSTPYSARGRFEGEPSGYGIDTIRGVRTSESDETVRGLSFLSYVRPGKVWSIALYRHQLADFESHTATNGLFGGGSTSGQRRAWDLVEDTDLEVVSYGFSAARRLTDHLSFGLGIQLHKGSLAISTRSFKARDDSVESVFAPNPYLPEREVIRIDYRVTDSSSVGVSSGLLWKRGQWRFGGAYRLGPRVSFAGVATAGPANDFGVPAGTTIGSGVVRVEFPDVVAVGGAFQTSDGRLTIGVEWDRVEYGSILASLGKSDSIDVSNLSLEDGDEFHLGAEYVFLASNPLVAVRAGIWHDPNHRAKYTGTAAYGRAMLPSRDDNLHYAIGLGLALRNVQVDIGADISEIVNTFSVSAIRTF